jgi:DNA mismatch repair ATPase MutS
MNETFASTSLRDARLLGTAILERLIDLDLRGVYVTFVDELTMLGPSVVSMVGTVTEDDPSVRTYKVVRRPADGIAYAISLAERHGLTAPQLKGRIPA